MAWSLVAHTAAQAKAAITTAGINTTGADLITIVLACSGSRTFTLSDNHGNSFTARTQYTGGSSDAVQIFYVHSPTVGSSHTFSISGVNGGDNNIYGTLCVAAFSGSAAAPYDTENGSGNGGATNLTSAQPGSITPAQASELLISGLVAGNAAFTSPSINSSFTIADSGLASPGNWYGGGLAYLVDSAAAAINPAWSWTGASDASSNIAAFKPAAGGGFTAVNRRTLGPRVGSRSAY